MLELPSLTPDQQAETSKLQLENVQGAVADIGHLARTNEDAARGTTP
jgi:hypothetical protein